MDEIVIMRRCVIVIVIEEKYEPSRNMCMLTVAGKLREAIESLGKASNKRLRLHELSILWVRISVSLINQSREADTVIKCSLIILHILLKFHVERGAFSIGSSRKLVKLVSQSLFQLHKL